MKTAILYDCEICGAMHPWEWNGDCRDDANRFGCEEDYARALGISVDDIEIRTMDERVEADG